VLEKLEKDAGERKKGLWVDPAPVSPWAYRTFRRNHELRLKSFEELVVEAAA
jgi:endonuclease YncB( thermonuclease family)